MIVECPACRTRFRLDETKITGRGARVRCRRCGETIVVLRPEASQGTEAGEAPLDLGSEVRKVVEAPQVPEEPPPPAPSERTAAKDEIDAAFAKLLDSGRADRQSSAVEEEPGVPAEPAADFRPEEKVEPEGDSSPGGEDRVLSLDSQQDASLRPAAADDAGKQPAESAPSDFMVSNDDTLDLLKTEYAKEREGGPKVALDISRSLRHEPPPAAESEEIPGKPHPPSVLPVAEDETRAAPPQEHAAQPLEQEAAGGEAVSPQSPPEAAPAKERQEAAASERRRPAASSIRPSLVALVLLFLALAGGGGYLGFTKSGQEFLRRMFPGMEPPWGRGSKAGPQLDVRNLIGYYEANARAGNLFVIKGQVANTGRTRKSGIRIHSGLLDDKDRTIKETSSYAGNVLTGEALRAATREKIEEVLSNKFGDRLVNMDVPPGKSIPFMVVFFDAPVGVSAYRLEAKEGE